MPRPMRNALLVLRVQTPAPTPHLPSLAISSASASSLNVVTVRTGPKDLLLEDPHLVVPLEDGRLEKEAAPQVAVRGSRCGKNRSPVLADFELGFQSSRGLLCRSPGRRN